MQTDNNTDDLEISVFRALAEKLGRMQEKEPRDAYITAIIKTINPNATQEQVERILKDSSDFGFLEKYLNDQDVEDVMVNNIRNVFISSTAKGTMEVPDKVNTRVELENLVDKLKMYATTETANNKIFDVHMPNGSRVNIVDSPLGADITIRNFRKNALSMIDLIRIGEMSYQMAARLWIYVDGLKVRPANMLIGGMPASGKTTLLNSMFSFFRPDERIVVIEETYELNTETQDNCVRLETSPDIEIADLVKNALRMRPDMIIIGEVRGEEAKDMMTAMNIGKISMGTIHAGNTRDVITRLQNTPMNVDQSIIPLIDTIVMISQVKEKQGQTRRITQVSEISGIETRVLLSDLYTYDYKTHRGSDILPSVTYRDTLAKISGYTPADIIEEENRRAKILQQLDKMNIRDLKSINEFCKNYYDNPASALAKINMEQLGTLE